MAAVYCTCRHRHVSHDYCQDADTSTRSLRLVFTSDIRIKTRGHHKIINYSEDTPMPLNIEIRNEESKSGERNREKQRERERKRERERERRRKR